MSVELNRIVETVTDQTRADWSALARRRGVLVTLRRSLDAGSPRCKGDAEQISQVVVALVNRAADAMAEGGTLTIRTDTARAENGQREAVVEVRDSCAGAGAHEDRICAIGAMVKRQGGKLSVADAPGGGTIVRVAFAAERRRTRLFGMPEPRNILLVDDDESILDSTTIVLELDGHTVAAATNGEDGVALAARAATDGKPFDVVITDLTMPGMDGHAVAAAIKAKSPGTSVILMTGLVADKGPADHVVNKPPQIEEINRLLLACAAGQA
jgi:CheY-like chemotaxis protein